jgi:hypothetical protein
MAKASDKNKGPRPVEIAISAVLSVILGLLGAAVFLALQDPVEQTSVPSEEEREFGRVYYVPGNPGGQQHATWTVKREVVQRGRSGTVPLVAEELNQWAATEWRERRPGESSGPVLHVRPGIPRFRMEDSVFHVNLPLEWSAFGQSREFKSQAHGGFTRRGGIHVFDHDRVYIGSMPVPNLFGLSNSVVRRVVNSFEVSQELRDGWARLEDVTVEGETLRLTIP